MNKKIYFGIGLAILLLGLIFFINKNNFGIIKAMPKGDVKTEVSGLVNAKPQGKMVTGTDQETFSGTITAVDTGCFSDAICSVTVDGKKIILVQGGRGQSSDAVVGKLVGVGSIGELEQKIGEHANVYAAPMPDGAYSLYGNDKYYVEVVDLKK